MCIITHAPSRNLAASAKAALILRGFCFWVGIARVPSICTDPCHCRKPGNNAPPVSTSSSYANDLSPPLNEPPATPPPVAATAGWCNPTPVAPAGGASATQAKKPLPPSRGGPSQRTQPAAHLADQALRARHQCVDARPDVSIFRFEEHDVFPPMITLEELDGHKGMTEVARNVRQVSRDLTPGASLEGAGVGKWSRPAAWLDRPPARPWAPLFFQTTPINATCPPASAPRQGRQPDPGVVQALKEQQPAAKWCWCPKTSTCASRPAPWACRPRTTATTRSLED